MDARRELDDHTSTLHVGSKIRLHGLVNQTLNGKKGTVLGPARHNRLGIQLQGEKRKVSIRILNIRYLEGPELNRQKMYDKVVAKVQCEIEFLKNKLQLHITNLGNKHIDTALARYSLGKALWLSNKPLETTQAVEKFEAAILFMIQREPSHYSLGPTKKVQDMALESMTQFNTPGTRSAWPYWQLPSARWQDEMDMTKLLRELLAMTDREKEATISANAMIHELRGHGLHDFCTPTPPLIDQTTFIAMACNELETMKTKFHDTTATIPRPTTSNTKLQSSPSSAGDDT